MTNMGKTYIDNAPADVLARAFGPHTDADVFPDPRLQQLREEFEAARAAYLWCFDPSDEILGDADDIGSWWDDLISPEFSEKVRMVRAARRYIIARDFNEFDPQRADMLWKLQNGGAL